MSSVAYDIKKNEWHDLIKKDWNKKYVAYIERQQVGSNFQTIIKALEDGVLIERPLDHQMTLRDLPKFKRLANPYYLGFGNPDADILFIGKEKAFNIIDSPELLFFESVNNSLQWEILTLNGRTRIPDQFPFNPLFPTSYSYGKKFQWNHTWGTYHRIISEVYGPGFALNEKEDFQSSFFNKCFITEQNHLPAKVSSDLGSSVERMEILKHEFFKSFKVIVIGTNKLSDSLKSIFLPQQGTQIKDSFGLRSIKHSWKIDNGATVILCHQLSGRNWPNTKVLTDEISSALKN